MIAAKMVLNEARKFWGSLVPRSELHCRHFAQEPVEGLSRVAYVAMSGEGQQDALAQVDNLDDLKKIALAVGAAGSTR
jgi:hypothetical protein